MDQNAFKIQSYSWKELATFYSPDLTPTSAARQLRRWIDLHPTLNNELTLLGWVKGNRRLTPRQVESIIHYLGEP